MAERQKKARELLAEAGFGPDNPLKFEFLHMQSTDGKRIATALQGMWAAIGVQDDPGRPGNQDCLFGPSPAEFRRRAGRLDRRLPRCVLVPLSRQDVLGRDELRQVFQRPVRPAQHRRRQEPDAAKRGALLNQAEQILLDDAPFLPIYNAVSRYLVEPYVKGSTMR